MGQQCHTGKRHAVSHSLYIANTVDSFFCLHFAMLWYITDFVWFFSPSCDGKKKSDKCKVDKVSLTSSCSVADLVWFIVSPVMVRSLQS